MSLSGKVALVLGSTRGLGLEISKRLCREGAQVYIGSRRHQNVQTALQEFKQENLTRVEGTVCHVLRQKERQRFIENAVKEFGKIDILVNTVACNPVPHASLLKTEERAYDKIMDTNVKAMFFMIKEVVPHMTSGGSILCMSSLVGHRPQFMPSVYAMSKTALNCCVNVMAPELANLNIRINGISPGLFDTEFGNFAIQNEKVGKVIVNSSAMKRLGKPVEVGGIAAFLCSDDASFITGENIVISGGAR